MQLNAIEKKYSTGGNEKMSVQLKVSATIIEICIYGDAFNYIKG
jgi:hypothetical protein